MGTLTRKNALDATESSRSPRRSQNLPCAKPRKRARSNVKILIPSSANRLAVNLRRTSVRATRICSKPWNLEDYIALRERIESDQTSILSRRRRLYDRQLFCKYFVLHSNK